MWIKRLIPQVKGKNFDDGISQGRWIMISPKFGSHLEPTLMRSNMLVWDNP